MSNLTHVHVFPVQWSTGGNFQCEVTSEGDYEMVTSEETADVVGEAKPFF